MTPFEKYQNRYLKLILSENWLEEMKIVAKQTLDLYRSFSENEGNFAYENGKWSLKTLLEHLTDTEKIFACRALCLQEKMLRNYRGLTKNCMLKTEQLTANP